MKKHLKEEKTVLPLSESFFAEANVKPGSLKTYLLIFETFFFSFFLGIQITAQVPLNGFCRFQEFDIKPNYSRIFAVDYTRDGYRGMIVFNQFERKYLAVTFDSRSKQFKPVEKYSSAAASNIHPLGKDERGNTKFAFVSRIDRTAGVLSILKSGTISITSKIKFDSYPNNIDVSDIDKDGKPELLVSGTSFKGLSILKNTKKGWEENNIGDNRTFSYSAFIDLDYDSYADVAAVDLFTNSIRLFYNDGTGVLSQQRSINLEGNISEFQSADINVDGFTDFIFINNRHVEILFGDSVSTFQKKLVINPETHADKYAVFDFNGDGYNDIAFINTEDGSLSISFAANANTFYRPFIYLKQKGIVDLAAYVDRGGRKLCVLSKNGKIYLINRVIDYNDAEIAVGLNPIMLGTFNYLNDRSLDFFAIDEERGQLKFFLNAGTNLFDKYYEYKLSQNCSRVVVNEQDFYKKTFYCYSPGERMIEIVDADFDIGSFSRRILYTDGPITDLKLDNSKSRDGQTIYLLINNRGTLYLQSFEFRDFRFLRSGLDSLSSNVESAAFCFGKEKEVFFYTKYGNTLYLNKMLIKPVIGNAENISSIPLADKKNISYEIKCFDDKDLNERPALSIINENGNTEISILNRGNYNVITINDFVSAAGFTKYYDEKKVNKLFMYDKLSGMLKRIVLSNNFYTYDVSNVFESKNLNSYIVAPINYKNDYLIYTDTIDNLIKLKAIQ